MFDLSECNVMVVDDTEENLDILVETLGDDYEISVATDGEMALQYVAEDKPDIILLDIMMPGMDGYEVCARLKRNHATEAIPVIFLTALSEDRDEARGLTLGAVDYITKPFNPELVKSRVRNHLELKVHRDKLEILVDEQVKEISDSQLATIFAMSKLAESRDEDTGKHLERTQIYCKRIAETLIQKGLYSDMVHLDYPDIIYQASPLHDIGKVAIADDILLKPAKLSDEQFAEMKTHTQHGATTLTSVAEKYPNNACVNMGVSIAMHHHEKWNGQGYPDGISGEDIPLSARIMAIADVYDALRSKRCYKEGFSHEKSRDIIVGDKGTHFDPILVDVFLELENEFESIHNELMDK